MSTHKVLVVGASGLCGTAAINAFANASWSVVGTSQREPEFVDVECEFLSLDLRDADAY